MNDPPSHWPRSESSAAWQSLRATFLASWPDEAAHVGALIGCSGGADSVALTRLIVARQRECFGIESSRKPPLVIAHFNHSLRGADSLADEQFVHRLAEDLRVPFALGHAPDSDSGDAEANLRRQRYDFFHDVASQSGCRYITLAHTADDQSETILHHLFRGTGAFGLTGMPMTRSLGSDFVIRRPLLRARRADIRRALLDIGQSWREDTSNQETRYTRNWIRHDVMPILRKRFPGAEDAILRASENQSQCTAMLSRLAQQWFNAFAIDPPQRRAHSGASGLAQSITLVRPRSASVLEQSARTQDWPHSILLANELPIITAACQLVFDTLAWPRGQMTREHWLRLAVAIAVSDPPQGQSWESRAPDARAAEQPPVSLGHWPGAIEALQSPGELILRRTRCSLPLSDG